MFYARTVKNTTVAFTKLCRSMNTKTSSKNKAKILFTDTGHFGDGSVSLSVGAPANRHLQKVERVLNEAHKHTQTIEYTRDLSYLQYGSRQGSPRYREQTAKFLSEGYGDTVSSDNLTVTAGATHGLHLIGSVILPRKATIFVEDPTFFIAITILRDDLELNIVPVPTDENGIDVNILEQLLIEHSQSKACKSSERKPFTSMIYVIPTHNNPRGYDIPPGRCKDIVTLARKYESLVFCDDVYNLLHFDNTRKPSPRLLTYDQPSDPDYKGGNVLSNGSFSKIMSPALRLGWIEAGPRITNLCTYKISPSYTRDRPCDPPTHHQICLIHQICNVMLSAGSANHYTSEIVASALALGLEQQYLKELNAEYQGIVITLCTTLNQHLPKSCMFNWPKGGYFIWIEMPENAIAAEVAKIAFTEHKVKILEGQMCSPTGRFRNCIRISCSHFPVDVLVDATRKLCSAISKHLDALE